jgi:hypothetical protein
MTPKPIKYRSKKGLRGKWQMKTIIDMQRIKALEQSDFSKPETQREVFSLIESLCGIIIAQHNEIQELKDEINRLKGEKGTPKFKSSKNKIDKQKDKTTMEKSDKKEWTKGSKKDKIKIDRTETVELDKTGLPADIEFKGYEERVVQNIIIKTDNVLYRLEKYYSPSLGKTYTAEVDESLKGKEFGAETKALISALYYENRVTENKIASFLNSNGLLISEGTISNILIKEQSEALSAIKEEILEAGLGSSVYQQIDDTGMKVAGKNSYATIICNEKYSVFSINFSKSRETVRSILTAFFVSLFVVLVGDDAPQFKKIAKRFALCWVHEERHYKKLAPILDCHRAELERIRGEIWQYYNKLKAYKKNPTNSQKSELRDEFDLIFRQNVSYDELSNRLALTFAKKHELLTALDYPEVPLHNNLSEIGVREIVIKRKISGGVETEDGRRAWENNMSILATCKKLGVSFYDYMIGVFSKNITIDLPELIR